MVPSVSDSARMRKLATKDARIQLAREKARLAEEVKAIVAMAIRNGPIEDLRSQISQDEMRRIVHFRFGIAVATSSIM